MIQIFPYHLVGNSPWPALLSLCLFNFTFSIVELFHGTIEAYNLYLTIISTLLVISEWFKDINSEGAYLGAHTLEVKNGLVYGFLAFVFTEIIFFVSIFWAYFHITLSPAVELGTIWPPKGIEALSPWSLPLLNTILLLSSGAYLTLAHHYVIAGKRLFALIGFTITIILSVIFTSCQLVEFNNASFTLADSAFATVFYFGTTFHGIHVLFGTIILIIATYRFINYNYTNHHNAGIEGAIIYWHIVDVVWLLLFIFVYWLFY